MYAKYQPLVDYLSDVTGETWELSITTTYGKTVQELCEGTLDVAYLGPLTYVQAHEACGAVPVVRLNTEGRATFRSVILVKDESPVTRLEDLRGEDFGFGSPLSTSSHLVPRAMLRDAGLRQDDIGCHYYGHHERAARACLLGEVVACGVRDIVGYRFTGRGLRVLARSGPIPNFPFVVGPDTSEGRRALLVEALVRHPAEDPAIRERMRTWDTELAHGFVPTSDHAYDPVRELATSIFGPRALELDEEELQCPAEEAPGS
jgi:phosphonate transport system substrate-binding protein